MLYTPSRVFVLLNETRLKGWFRSAVDTLFAGERGQYLSARYVQVYDISNGGIERSGKVT